MCPENILRERVLEQWSRLQTVNSEIVMDISNATWVQDLTEKGLS